ncbi:hypothetical protein OH809_43650 [Streptomyces sp. NBC_00873]|uniref:hypothetical protein n=1 Tax=unclassified Streptomyces TaxID=2593676 RepID=UPI00386805FF|nr:hypothetical protein OH809_00060 [Streptomyces sp. NBC_00873]WSY96909.1 hypothetical protein OH809_43650 [Streptomyces sp. NBC_00873]WTA41318.1 hypothetical protein OH821_00060 [Streptomyces sp. NBC_00842]WTA48579.1 hypothetical protein OH821_43755 [Streptomyces sp. NBC_00842]WTE37112.1 hypothetical protein OH735_30795 [Streptomyces sp. NBC_01618]
MPGTICENKPLLRADASPWGPPVEHGFTHLKNWRTLTKLRTDPARATHLLRALLVRMKLEVSR